MVWSALYGLPINPSINSGYERAIVPLLLVLIFGRTIGGAFTGVLVSPHLAIEVIEDGSDFFFTRGMAGGDVEELLGGSRALTSQLVNQGLAGGPGTKSSYDVGVGDVGQLVALPEEAPDVPTKSFPKLLSAVLEIPQVPSACVCALEISHEDLF